MAAYRKTNTLTIQDAAYIAGLVDGEGTVTLSRKHRGDYRQPSITISNTDEALLHYVRQTVGTGKITHKRVACSRHTPSFTYAVYNRQALRLLEQLHPYLRTYKAQRGAMILHHYPALTPRNGKYGTRQREARERFDAAVLEINPG